MSLIPCIENCIYQRNGRCELNWAVPAGKGQSACAYFVKCDSRSE